MNKPELLSPAGDMEKLKIAFQYGADAVYASTPKFSMRTREIGFDSKSLNKGIKYAHSIDKKVYLTLNTFPHADEITEFKKHALETIKLNPDAIISADPGVISFIKKNSDIPIHLSTQANTTNQLSAEFWKGQGVSRIVLARELSLEDIKIISKNSTMFLETFIHGAMCMAYSGRCQISNYMTGRDPNRGQCIQACRFKYKIYELEEEFRQGEKFQLYEDKSGSYILNSKDLCMIEHIPELIEAGVQSFKIEGRLKSIYYVGAVTRAYRQAIDLYFENEKEYQKKKKSYFEELTKTSNRGFTTGFYLGKPDKSTNNYASSRASEQYKYVGLVKKYYEKKKLLEIEVKNHINLNDEIEIVTPTDIVIHKVVKIIKADGLVGFANPNDTIYIPFEHVTPKNSFLRIKCEKLS